MADATTRCPACDSPMKAGKSGLMVCKHCDRPHEACALCKKARAYRPSR